MKSWESKHGTRQHQEEPELPQGNQSFVFEAVPNKIHSPLAARGQQPGVPGHTLTAGQLCRATRCKCQALGIENSEDHRVKGALLFTVSLALFRNRRVFCCVLFRFFFPIEAA